MVLNYMYTPIAYSIILYVHLTYVLYIILCIPSSSYISGLRKLTM